MSEADIKPLKWKPEPGVGYTVVRRPDGGMHITFTDVNPATLKHWRDFATEHLLDSDRLTRNLYDLRALKEVPDDAVQLAAEVNADPSTKNIRIAVVVASTEVAAAVEKIIALTPGGGAEIKIFTDMENAEAWLSQPVSTMV